MTNTMKENILTILSKSKIEYKESKLIEELLELSYSNVRINIDYVKTINL